MHVQGGIGDKGATEHDSRPPPPNDKILESPGSATSISVRLQIGKLKCGQRGEKTFSNGSGAEAESRNQAS